METVAVIFGGRSTEHDVSIVTAIASIIKPLELSRNYTVEAVYIAKDGAWYWDERLKDIKLFTSGRIAAFMKKTRPAGVQFTGGMTLTKPSSLPGRQTSRRIDLVFPAMHGTYGEDGALPGLLDMAGVPYVGCGLAASALAMDKILAKQVAAAKGISITDYVTFARDELADKAGLDTAVKAVTKKLAYPVFIKPPHLGSSIGITRATDDTSLRNGLEVAAHYDTAVLVETAVQNLIEVTLPIMGNERPVPALLEQPLTKAEDFFDFETKYLQGGKKGKRGGKGAKGAQGYSQIPASLPKELYAKAEATGLTVYKALGCSGTDRLDMLMDS